MLAQFLFSRIVDVAGTPTQAFVQVAVDDLADVLVNGALAGSMGSTTDVDLAGAAQKMPSTFDILPFLHNGTNTITIRATNGSGAFAGDCANCSYAENSAGVLFCAELRY